VGNIAADVRAVVAGGEAAQRYQQGSDLLAGDLESPTDAVAWAADQAGAVDQIGRRIPGRPMLVQVEVLQRHRHDQIAPAGQDTGALRASEALAATEGNQVGS